MTCNSPKDRKLSASHSLEGYVYQRDVTVWLALTLIIEKQACEALIVEPANEEDAEAAIKDPDGADINLKAIASEHTLSFQIKSRSTGPWKLGSIKRLLLHGKRRPSPLKQLQDPNRKYVIVTDADLEGVTRRLFTRSPLALSRKIPKSIQALSELDLNGRLGIIARLDREKLDSRVEAFLKVIFKVPTKECEGCYKALGERVFALMRQGGGLLTRSVIIDVIQRHGGYLGGFSDNDIFVPPSNLQAFHDILNDRHAIIIRGPSGTGKTRLSLHLIDEIVKATTGPCTHIKVDKPGAIRAACGEDPVVFEIEDPWGRYGPSDRAAEWATDMQTFCRSADDSRKFVVTTRSDLFQMADVKNLDDYILDLTGENYTSRARAKIYDARLERLPLLLKPIAHAYRGDCLKELVTPLEIEKLFDLLRGSRLKDERDYAFIRRALEAAKTEAIEDRIVKTIAAEKRQDEAALTWGLLEAFPRLDRSVVDQVVPDSSGISESILDGLDGFLASLISKHTLRAKDGRLTYRHNRDEKGLRNSFEQNRRSASRILNKLVASLLLQTSIDFRRSAISLAYRMNHDPSLTFDLPPESRSILNDELLEAARTAAPNSAEQIFMDLAGLGSGDFLPARLARWLTHRRADKMMFGLATTWSPLEESTAFYDVMAAEETTADLVRAYIRNAVPVMGRQRLDGFAVSLYRLDPGIGETFRELLSEHLDELRGTAIEFFADGAFIEVEHCDNLGGDLIIYFTDKNESEIFSPEQQWDYVNEIMPEEESQHHFETYGMDHEEAESILSKYVSCVRDCLGWEKLTSLPLTSSALAVWLDVIRKNESTAPPAELLSLHGICREADCEQIFWQKVGCLVSSDLRERVENIALMDPPSALRNTVLRVWAQTNNLAIETAVGKLRATRGSIGVVEVINHLRQDESRSKDKKTTSSMLLNFTNLEERAVLDFLSENAASDNLTDPTLVTLLRYLSSGSRDFDLSVTKAIARAGGDIDDQIRLQLDKHYDPFDEERAYLDRLLMVISQTDRSKLLVDYRDHPHSVVVAASLKFELEGTKQFPIALLPMLDSQSRDVLDVAFDFLDNIDVRECQHALERLTSNNARSIELGHQYTVHYGYAYRAAKRILDEAESVSPEFASQCLEMALSHEDRSLSEVCIDISARFGNQAIIDRLFLEVLNSKRALEVRIGCVLSLVLWGCKPDFTVISGDEILEHLRGHPIKVVKWSALLIGLFGPTGILEKVCADLKTYKNRPLLSLPVSVGLYERNDTLFLNHALSVLDPVIAEKVRCALRGESIMTPDDVDGIGYIGVRQEIVEQLKGQIFETVDADN